jgi:lariat debranching enzyme
MQTIQCNAIDVFMSHDWPAGVTAYGQVKELIRTKPHFREQIEAKKLGCETYWELMKQHRPRYWLSAHFHAQFEAHIPHVNGRHTTTIHLLLGCVV